MNVCVIGDAGNMGRRYMAILRGLKQDYAGVDFGWTIPKATHYIIATPTRTHLDVLAKVIDKYGTNGDLSILIEKPVTKNPNLLKFVLGTQNKIYMVNQYAYHPMTGRSPAGIETEYNYYSSGNDGLPWDCIQLLHLAKGEVELSNQSPVWLCKINGYWIDRAKVDHYYMRMIKDFITDGKAYGRLWGPEDIIAAHDKALQYEKTIDRSAGP